jgi:protease PrsW
LNSTFLISPAIGLLPVVTFLGALLYFDSYKLVKLHVVVAVILSGGVVAGASYLTNGILLNLTQLEMPLYSALVAPLCEEMLKGFVVYVLIRQRRIGFLIDAAIFGFAVGAGFAVIENSFYFLSRLSSDVGIGTWIIRGFGTAIMHGGATAIFALISMDHLEQRKTGILRSLVPGLGLAVVIHSAYNLSFLPPIYMSILVFVSLPLILYVIFERSEKSIGEWLGTGFDSDAEMLALINSGNLTGSPLGAYLLTLKDKFTGPIIADILCYIRLHSELALRAKGLLIMRENGFEVPVDEETRSKFEELSYLLQSIGKTGQLAIQPMLHLSHKDLWQLNMLEK